MHPIRRRRARHSRAARAGISLVVAAAAFASPGSHAVGSAPEARTQLDLFRDVANTIPVGADTFSVAGSIVEVHPLVQFLSASVDVSALIDPSPVSIAQIDSMLPVSWRLAPDFPEQEEKWLARAEFLGGAYIKLGLDAKAQQWLRAAERHSPSMTVKARARHILVYSYTTNADTTALASLALTWSPAMLEGDSGRKAAVAMLCGLHLLGKTSRVLEASNRLESLDGYETFFRALYQSENGRLGEARIAVDQFLQLARRDKEGVYPTSLRLAALLLAADIDWQAGMDGRAEREYELLSRFSQPYVRSWTRFMLGSIAMFNTHYDLARQHFNSLCSDEGGSMWHDVACTLEAHSTRMLEMHVPEASE